MGRLGLFQLNRLAIMAVIKIGDYASNQNLLISLFAFKEHDHLSNLIKIVTVSRQIMEMVTKADGERFQ